MTAHELARKLLDGPDLPVGIGCYFDSGLEKPDPPHVEYVLESKEFDNYLRLLSFPHPERVEGAFPVIVLVEGELARAEVGL